MSKHTPGPWGVDRETWTIRSEQFSQSDLMGDYRGCVVADLSSAHGNRDHAFAECEANARLIAAKKIDVATEQAAERMRAYRRVNK